MKLSSDQLKDAFQRRTARRSGRSAACLEPEVIARLASRDLNAGERERATDHILSCSDCADELGVARSLSNWADDTAASVAGPTGSTAHSVPAASVRVLRFFARPRFLQTAAALLLVGSSGLVVELLILRGEIRSSKAKLDDAISHSQGYEKQIAELRRNLIPAQEIPSQGPDASMPQVNVPIIDLDPRDIVRGELKTPVVVLVPATSLVTFILNPEEPPMPGEYGLEIVDPTGNISWRSQGLAPGTDDTFTIAVPARMLLPAGLYHFRLSRVSKTQMILIHDYALQVRFE